MGSRGYLEYGEKIENAIIKNYFMDDFHIQVGSPRVFWEKNPPPPLSLSRRLIRKVILYIGVFDDDCFERGGQCRALENNEEYTIGLSCLTCDENLKEYLKKTDQMKYARGSTEDIVNGRHINAYILPPGVYAISCSKRRNSEDYLRVPPLKRLKLSNNYNILF